MYINKQTFSYHHKTVRATCTLLILFSYLAGDTSSFPGAAISFLKATEAQEEPDSYIHTPVATDGKIMEEAQR